MLLINCEVQTPNHINEVTSRNSNPRFYCAGAPLTRAEERLLQCRWCFVHTATNRSLCGSKHVDFTCLQASTGWARWNVVHRVLNFSSSKLATKLLRSIRNTPQHFTDPNWFRHFASKFFWLCYVHSMCFPLGIVAAIELKRASSQSVTITVGWRSRENNRTI